MDHQEKIKALPNAPGVYLMKNAGGEVIYVGKATSLKKRVASYFRGTLVSARLDALVNAVADIEHIVTANEADALLLENALIKSKQPKYNVALRDDKTYPFLKLTLQESFPRLLITRTKKDDGARYFGPFTEAGLLREALQFLRRVFPLRTCRTLPKRACLNSHLRQCWAPCAGKIDARAYGAIVERLIMFLEGKRPALVRDLEREMADLSEKRRYEEAGRVRDQILALSVTIPQAGPAAAGDQLEALMRVLHLPRLPRMIEAFDISNISGTSAVGSLVVFKDGKPHKDGYKRFKIRDVTGIDDYRMMREIVSRRYQGVIGRGETLPELIIIDGGKGHLSSAREELIKLGLTGIPVISIAKEFEQIFVPERHVPIKLPAGSPGLVLVQRVRDEAHRFAITYHKNLRSAALSSSVLDDIKGVGTTRKIALLKHFGSVEGVKRATTANLQQVKGIDRALASEIKKRVRG